jgi:hypothetical protein
MDQNLNQNELNSATPMEHVSVGTVVPMGETWAEGVSRVPVSPRSRRLRWGIAGAIVVSVVTATVAGAFVLSGGAGAKSLTASAAPKNAIAFLEVRADLPGDQHAKLADFMSHFPGFKDRAQFDNALDELLNKLTGSVSPELTYSSAFKPWMEGEVSVAIMDMGSGTSTMSMTVPAMVASPAGDNTTGMQMDLPSFEPVLPSNYTPPSAVAIFALKDRAAAQTWVSGELVRNNVTATAQSYAGTTLYEIGSGAGMGAYAFTDQDLLLGTIKGVEAALDSKTNGSLADNANYQAAMKSLSGDSLARFYLDSRSLAGMYLDSYNQMMEGFGNMPGVSPMPTLAISTQDLPAWVAGSVRAESDHMAVDMAYPRSITTDAGNHVSRLAPLLPASTVGIVEVHSIGKLVTDQLAALEAKMPAGSTTEVQSIKDVLTRVGGIDWLGDGVAVVTSDGSTYGGGLVVEAPDATTASTKATLITNLVALAGGSLNLTSRSETYKGVDITVITAPGGSAGMPLEVAVASSGNLLLAGYTDQFVKAVIDTTPATSLASQPDYSAVMAAAGSSNETSFYLNIPALEDQIGQAVLASSPTRWTLDYKPYFDHLGGIGYSVIDGNTVILRFVVTAK